MPLTSLVRGLPNTPESVRLCADKIYFRNTILVYLEVDSESLFPDQWLYIHCPELLHGRVTNFRNWCPSLYGEKKTTILCLEFWAFEQDPLWSAEDASLTELAKTELQKSKLLPAKTRVLNHHVLKLSRSYPVYETGYMQWIKPIQEHVSSIKGLYCIGRGGSFKYNNQDHSILAGLLAADEIKTGVPQGLWELNSDSEYQEDAKLSSIPSLYPSIANK